MQLIITRQWKQVKINAKLCGQDYSKICKWALEKLGFICIQQSARQWHIYITLHQNREEISIL